MRRGFISRLPSVITYCFSYSLIGLCCVGIWLHWTGKWFVTSGSLLLLCSIFLSLTCSSAQVLLFAHTHTHTQSDKHKFTKKHFRMSTYTQQRVITSTSSLIPAYSEAQIHQMTRGWFTHSHTHRVYPCSSPHPRSIMRLEIACTSPSPSCSGTGI